jgi:hypothetical protein
MSPNWSIYYSLTLTSWRIHSITEQAAVVAADFIFSYGSSALSVVRSINSNSVQLTCSNTRANEYYCVTEALATERTNTTAAVYLLFLCAGGCVCHTELLCCVPNTVLL